MSNSSFERLDTAMVRLELAPTRSQAESLIRLGQVKVDGQVATKPGFKLRVGARVELTATERYVSRAGLKLASVAQIMGLDFRGKTVLDVGSSTGGFTDYALQHGASLVYAVDVGTEQLHPSLRGDNRIKLYEKTDIRHVYSPLGQPPASNFQLLDGAPDIIVIDVSFISLRDILPHIAKAIAGPETAIIAMVKPQFEAGKHQTNKGVIKNESVRRRILADFEAWARQYFLVKAKRDSEVSGSKGNRERFYQLSLLAKS